MQSWPGEAAQQQSIGRGYGLEPGYGSKTP